MYKYIKVPYCLLELTFYNDKLIAFFKQFPSSEFSTLLIGYPKGLYSVNKFALMHIGQYCYHGLLWNLLNKPVWTGSNKYNNKNWGCIITEDPVYKRYLCKGFWWGKHYTLTKMYRKTIYAGSRFIQVPCISKSHTWD